MMICGLFLLAVGATCRAQQVIQANFLGSKDHMLNNGTFLEVSTASRTGCAAECLLQSDCWSFSYETSTGRCLMHNTDDVTSPASLVLHPGFSYFWRLGRTLRCQDSPGLCQHEGTCMDTSDGVLCQCPKWRYEGRTCQDRIFFYLQNSDTGRYLISVDGKIKEELEPRVDGHWYEVAVPPNMIKLRANTTGMYLGCSMRDYCYGTRNGSDPATTFSLQVQAEDDGSGRRHTLIKDANNVSYVCLSEVLPLSNHPCTWYYVRK